MPSRHGPQVEQLLFTQLAGAGFVLHLRGGGAGLYHGTPPERGMKRFKFKQQCGGQCFEFIKLNDIICQVLYYIIRTYMFKY